MHITTTPIAITLPVKDNCHILTYAEYGISPLTSYAKGYGLSETETKNFADNINGLKMLSESQSPSWATVPGFPISVLPRCLIMECAYEFADDDLRADLKDFLNANQQNIHANSIMIDFRTPYVDEFLFPKLVDFFATYNDPGLHQVLFINGIYPLSTAIS